MTISNNRIAELRSMLAAGEPMSPDVAGLLEEYDRLSALVVTLQQVAAARYADPDFLTAKVYPLSPERPDYGYKVFRTGEGWKWAWMEPDQEPEFSEEFYPTQVEALRAAADDWEESGGDPNIRIAATLRGLATRIENESPVDLTVAASELRRARS